jgi:hypothetical protein
LQQVHKCFQGFKRLLDAFVHGFRVGWVRSKDSTEWENKFIAQSRKKLPSVWGWRKVAPRC